jgi:hypothetical protein
MLCWVNKRTENQLQELNHQNNIPIVFVNTFGDFEKNIQEETFLLILRRKVDKNIRKLRKLFNSFKNSFFYAYVQDDDSCTTPREFELSFIENVIICNRTNVFELFQAL